MNQEWDNIKKQLRDAEAPLSNHAWDDMNAMLDQQASNKKKKVAVWVLSLISLIGITGIITTQFGSKHQIESDVKLEKSLPEQGVKDNGVAPKNNIERFNIDQPEEKVAEQKNENQEEVQKLKQPLAHQPSFNPDIVAEVDPGETQMSKEGVALNQKGYTRIDSPYVEQEFLPVADLATQVDNEQKTKASSAGWQLKAYAGPTYNQPNVKYVERVDYTHHQLATATTDALNGGWGFDAGIELSYQFNRFLKLGGGLSFRKIVTQNSYTYQTNEIPVIDSATQRIVGYIQSPNALPVDNNAYSTNTFTYVGVPVSLYYAHDLNSKWRLTGEFANGFNFLVQQNSYQINTQSLGLDASQNDAFNPLLISYQFRLGIQYALFRDLRLALEPSYRGHYNSIYKAQDMIWKPRDFSVNLALIYSF